MFRGKQPFWLDMMRSGLRGVPVPWRKLLRHTLIAFCVLTIGPVVALRWVPPPTSAFMLRAQIGAWMEGRLDFRLYYRWVPWEDIAPSAKLAVVAAEDQLFPDHAGFDIEALEKAWEHNQRSKHIHGASTISQQVAKNLFLYPGRSLLRKSLEAYFTFLIERFWSKRRILEVYLNVVQFGEGIYGVAEASHLYFGKPASQLGKAEAALLAAVLPNPIRFKVAQPSAYVLRRQRWIQWQMTQLGGVNYLHPL